MKYNIIIELDEQRIETQVEAKNWEMACEYVFGNIQVKDKDELEEDVISGLIQEKVDDAKDEMILDDAL